MSRFLMVHCVECDSCIP